MKTKLLLSGLSAFVMLAACTTPPVTPEPGGPPTDVPAICTVTGADSNTLPEATVTLTATAEGATSYVWFDTSGEIEGATDGTYVVTATGVYYATGVNAAGRGVVSDGKRVTINDPSDYEFDRRDLEGTYSAAGTPQGWISGVPNAASWTSEITYDETGEKPFYFISNWIGQEWGVFVDIDDDNRLTIDSETIVCSNQTEFVAGYLVACYMDADRKLVFVNPPEGYEVRWNSENEVLDFSGKVNGFDVVIFVVAFNMRTSEFMGGFTDGYKNLKLTKTSGTRAVTFSGEKVTVSNAQLYQAITNLK